MPAPREKRTAGSPATHRPLPRQRKPPDQETPQPDEPRAAGRPDRPRPGRSKTDRAIEAAIAALVADAPPLSEATRARLAELFSVTRRAGRS